MPVTQNDQITADLFNFLVTETVTFYGNGLGQICRPGTRFLESGEVITNEKWNDLILDIIDARHFTIAGSFTKAQVATNIPTPFVYPDGIPDDVGITAELYNAVENMIDTAQAEVRPAYTDLGSDNFSFTVPDDTNVGFTGTLDISFPGGYTYTSNALGETRVASNADHVRHFENAGGKIRTTIDTSNVPEDDKNQDYASMAALITDSAPVWSPTDGDSNFRTLATQTSAYNTYATATYGSNTLTLEGRRKNSFTNTVKFDLIDGSTGDPDEVVTLDFTVNNRVYYPTILGNNLKPAKGASSVVSQGITDYYVDIELPRTFSRTGAESQFRDPAGIQSNSIGSYNVPAGSYTVRVTGSVGVDGTREGFFGQDRDPAGDVDLIIRTLSFNGPDLITQRLISGTTTSAITKNVDFSFEVTGVAVHYAVLRFRYIDDGPHWQQCKLRFQLDPN